MEVDRLPPTQYLISEVLAARWRCGEEAWTFPSRLRWAAAALAEVGLVTVETGSTPRHFRVALTGAGRVAVLDAGYVSPNDRQAGADLVAKAREMFAGYHEMRGATKLNEPALDLREFRLALLVPKLADEVERLLGRRLDV